MAIEITFPKRTAKVARKKRKVRARKGKYERLATSRERRAGNPKKTRVQRMVAKKKSSASPQRKFDRDFVAGWKAGNRAWARNRKVSLDTAMMRALALAERNDFEVAWIKGFREAQVEARTGKSSATIIRLGLY